MNDNDTVLLFDGADAVGSVRPGSGQNDRYRAILIFFSQRTKKNINRMVDLIGFIFMKTEYIRNNFNIVLRGDHINMIAFHPHAVCDFRHRHHRIFAKNLGEQTLVIRRQMLNDDESHPCIRR